MPVMIRSRCIRALQDFLQSRYHGPVSILREEGDGEIRPPYALVRVGSAENIGMGQADIWDLNVIVAVFNDADAVAIGPAEEEAAAVFAALADPAAVIAGLATGGILASAWLPLTSEAGLDESRWQHFHGFRLLASPS